jgi:hypothetical protein
MAEVSDRSRMYVDRAGVRKLGEEVAAVIKAVHQSPLTTPVIPREHWSSISTVLIRCGELSWSLRKVAAFSKEGELIEQRDFTTHTPTFYAIPPGSAAQDAAKRICAAALQGKGLDA